MNKLNKIIKEEIELFLLEKEEFGQIDIKDIKEIKKIISGKYTFKKMSDFYYLNIKTSQSIFNNEDLKKLIECNIYSINISGNDNIQIKIK